VIEASHTDGAGAATGLKGGVTYVGAALAGAPIAMIQKYYSWDGVFGLLGIIAVILIILTASLILIEKRIRN
ncbi:MFS transporter, partial [Salmonella enterica]|nr:MFS transporter [Salmonella enterica]